MIGVDYELFWTLNPKSLTPFFKAFSMKIKYEDRMTWQQGAYIRMAIASCFNKDSKYPSSPLASTKLVQETEEEKQQRIKNKMFKQMEFLNQRFRKEDKT